jgi:hypothetical protein
MISTPSSSLGVIICSVASSVIKSDASTKRSLTRPATVFLQDQDRYLEQRPSQIQLDQTFLIAIWQCDNWHNKSLRSDAPYNGAYHREIMIEETSKDKNGG